MLKIAVGFEAGEERRGNLKVGDRYLAVDKGARPEWDREYVARWDGCRGVPLPGTISGIDRVPS